MVVFIVFVVFVADVVIKVAFDSREKGGEFWRESVDKNIIMLRVKSRASEWQSSKKEMSLWRQKTHPSCNRIVTIVNGLAL